MLPFLSNWTIDLLKLPEYEKFKRPFTVTFDKKICQILVSGINKNITKVMISGFQNNVLSHIQENDKLIVQHNNRHNLGRFYSDRDRSPCCHTKLIKHTVFAYQNWLDIDMVKGHTSILLYLGKMNGETLTAIHDVVHNWETRWREIAEYYKKKCGVELDEDNVKYYFNMTIYGGGYERWVEKLADKKDAEKYGYEPKIINPPSIQPSPFMKKFKSECVKIMKLVYKYNPAIVQAVTVPNESEYEKMCSTISYFCGVIENHIVYFVYNTLVRNGGILPNQCLPEMDGICLPRLLGVDYESLVTTINDMLKEIDIKFKIKPYGKFVLHDVIDIRREIDEKDYNDDEEYEEDDNTTNETMSVTAPTEQTIPQVNWDLSEAEFAKMFKKVCFNDNEIVFTGKGKEMDGYFYNGIYWEELSLHNAELMKLHFDKLYAFYIEQLKVKEGDEKSKKPLISQIKTLNSHKTRTNVIKIFKSDNYQANVEWNKNKNLFVFEDCVYDLEQGKFQEKTNPSDYINLSCGKKYNVKDLDRKAVETAKDEIKKFFEGVVLKEDEDFLLKLLASFLKQENKEEKGYFWLGRGRNGKGTISEMVKNILGKYWGELSMENYTTYAKDKDRPNQNLFNCRSARVLNSSEIADSNENNGNVKFISDVFKRMTGGDEIYARELGTKSTAYFKAGTVLIQTNKMPTFTKIDISLRERIVVVQFPYTFTDDTVLLASEPEKYKKKDATLKDKFATDEYRIALTDMLFEYYESYKNEFVIPESVKKYTLSYFAGETVKSFLDEHCERKSDSKFDLSRLRDLYNETTGKRLSVKQLKDELEELKYEIKRGLSSFIVKGIALKHDDDNDNDE